ncbi:MAG TPA: polysaccharide biosynthesis tyrosine autokinase [Candidatus Omnitrophota bacterium]|nr:polysaccharide biosynthesis tyrosine autokinase [Candidatus Omnitrophota bacterium]
MPQYELNIQDYLRILRKRKWIILLTMVSTFIGIITYNNLQTPVYSSSVSIKIEVRQTAITALTETILGGGYDVLATEQKVLSGRPVVEEAARRLQLFAKNASQDEIDVVVSNIQSGLESTTDQVSSIIVLTVQSDQPKKARDIANMIAEVYIEENLKQRSKEATQVREFIEKQLSDVETRLHASEDALAKFREKEAVTGEAVGLENRLGTLKSQLSELLTKATEKHPDVQRLEEQVREVEDALKKLPKSELEFARLQRDVNVNEKLYTMLREKFEESRISEKGMVSQATVINPAVEPQVPIKPNKRFAAVVGIVVGLMLGLILAFVTESLDTSIGTIEDVENLLKVPVLAIIPSIRTEVADEKPWWKRGLFPQMQPTKEEEREAALSVLFKPLSQIAESYRILRTNLKISDTKKAFLITSCGPQEGKTTVLVGLGITLAQKGIKTLIIDSDLRRPSVHKKLGITKESGINEIINKSMTWQDAIKGLPDILMGELGFDEVLKNPGLDNLSIITSGASSNNPSELLGSKAMESLIAEFRNNFDVILFDSPPSLAITDASVLAPLLDGVVIVYEMGRTARAALLRAKIQLQAVGANVLGVALNHIKPESYVATGYYPYYYHYKYKYADKQKEEKESQHQEST